MTTASKEEPSFHSNFIAMLLPPVKLSLRFRINYMTGKIVIVALVFLLTLLSQGTVLAQLEGQNVDVSVVIYTMHNFAGQGNYPNSDQIGILGWSKDGKLALYSKGGGEVYSEEEYVFILDLKNNKQLAIFSCVQLSSWADGYTGTFGKKPEYLTCPEKRKGKSFLLSAGESEIRKVLKHYKIDLKPPRDEYDYKVLLGFPAKISNRPYYVHVLDNRIVFATANYPRLEKTIHKGKIFMKQKWGDAPKIVNPVAVGYLETPFDNIVLIVMGVWHWDRGGPGVLRHFFLGVDMASGFRKSDSHK